MKKIICILLIFIILLSPLHIVKAADAITLTQGSIELLNNGIDFLSYSGGVPYGFLPFVFSSDKADYQTVIESMFDKQDVFVIDNTPNINIRPLNQSEYGLLENAYIYDNSGNIVNLQDLYFGEVDNGYFTEKFYCKNDGSIVYQDATKESPYIDVKFGGSEVSYVDWQNLYDSLGDNIESNNYNYDLDGFSNGNYSFYLAVGGNSGGRPEKATSLYIANQYIPGVVVPSANQGQRIKHWYTNDLSLFNYEVLYGTPNSYYEMTYESGNYTYNGNNYKYYVSYFANENLPTSPTNTYQNWVENGGSGLFAVMGYIYDSSLLNNDVVTYKKVLDNADSIDLSKAYSYRALSDYMDTLDSIDTYPSSTFDNTAAITATNYPFVFDIDAAVADVVLPFPDSIAIDDTPAIEYPLEETIDPSLISPNIPIISDLKNKFPFSIPWDIASILKGLEEDRETPYINTDVFIPGINYTWHIEYDLHEFDDLAALFRTLFLISFILGLAYFSYDHFFGS